jgi:uncharacterized protein (DUF2147 family)
MRGFLAFCAAALSLSSMALAAEPTGEWRVANGEANIRIDTCDGVLWGIISWERKPGIDSFNPNPAERNRPLLGSHVLLGMRPTRPGRWDGEIYNGENGKTYKSHIMLSSPDVLRVEGCVLGGLFCGGEDWTRVKTDAPSRAAPARGARSSGEPPATALNACSGIAQGPGAAHKSGLK